MAYTLAYERSGFGQCPNPSSPLLRRMTKMTVRRVSWYLLATSEAVMTGLIWFVLLLASSPHYHCPQDDVGLNQRLSWLVFAASEALFLTLVSAAAHKQGISRPATIIIIALTMLPLLLLGTFVLYAINSDWRCASS